MKIYLATRGAYDDYVVVGAFSAREKAEEFLQERALDRNKEEHPDAVAIADNGTWLLGDKWDYYQIEGFDVDALAPLEWVVWAGKYSDHESQEKFVGTRQGFENHSEEFFDVGPVELCAAEGPVAV